MKTLGIEKRSAILYARIRPSLHAWVMGAAKASKVSPNAIVERLIELARDANSNAKKPRSRS
jgi:predicted HicB family RNase H-like nuclease